jgi:hypothetical protein
LKGSIGLTLRERDNVKRGRGRVRVEGKYRVNI